MLSDGIKYDLERISKRIVSLEFDTTSHQPVEDDSDIDWARLLLAGSILARSSRRVVEESALRIATGALLVSDDPCVRDTGAVLLEKLSNSRATSLAVSRNLIAHGLFSRLGIGAKVEATRRAIEQSVLENFTGKWILVNDFQSEFWRKASSDSAGWLSASAPTASGKTFLVQRWLVDTMLTSGARAAIYIAPTRALVSEIESSLKMLIEKLEVGGSIDVASLPLLGPYQSAMHNNSKVIFVFTQERLHLLANVVGHDLLIDVLVVDEAHKIGDGGRGVILQAAIERISSVNPLMRAVFVSPSTQNPEILLEDAPTGVDRQSVNSDLPTVLQNVIYCSQVAGNPRDWALKLRLGPDLLSLGVLKLAHRPTNISKKIALIAAAAGSRGGTLVYANGAAEAEKIAVIISQAVKSDIQPDVDLANLADLARKGVHPAYQLANVVENGVAFHYGNMPSLLRLEIEKLFRDGKLRFLVCTSTLVEGVNLSCRTIVVRGPKKGRENPMEPPDFWNLAGRAGRWGNEFQGNIICIDPNVSSVWPSGVPERARYPIQRETDAVMNREHELEAFVDRRLEASPKEVSAQADLEQVTSYLLSSYIKHGSIKDELFAKRHSDEYIDRLNTKLSSLANGIEFSGELVARHPGVSAVGMQKLLAIFRGEAGREETLIPESPESDGAYGRLCAIMKMINSTLYPAFMPETRIPLYSLVVLEWLRGYSLSYMIRKRIDYHKRHGQQIKIAEIIRTTMELVEQFARFRAPKYLAAYMDVLRFHLEETGRVDLLREDIDIGVALEFGVSTKTLLSLMELGLSRMSAVALNELIADDNLSQDHCVRWIAENVAVIIGSDIPDLILREISSVSKVGLKL